jgi:hypothetical protein
VRLPSKHGRNSQVFVFLSVIPAGICFTFAPRQNFLPHSLPSRLILHETLLCLRDLEPHIAAEFRQPVELLQQRYPVPDPQANAILEHQLQAIYSNNETSA